MERRTASGPGAPLPPTLIYAGGFGLGSWMESGAPLWSGWNSPRWLVAVGLLLALAGLAGFIWGMATFFRLRTGIMLQRAATRVVDLAPYCWSRNPQYVSFTLMYAGLAIATGFWWPLLLLPLVLLLVTGAVIAREERYMRSTFGATYDDYCRRVRRWI